MLREIHVELDTAAAEAQDVTGLDSFGKELAAQRMTTCADPDATVYISGYTPTTASGFPFAGKLSLYGVSQLGGNLQGSRSGGLMGRALTRLGIAGVQVSGLSQVQQVLHVDATGRPSLRPLSTYGSDIAGTRALASALYAEHGEGVALAVVDPTTTGFRYSALVCNRVSGGPPSRAAARGTTILGSNGLVAIVAETPPEPLHPLEPTRLAKARKLQARMARKRANRALAGSDAVDNPLLGGTYGAAARGRIEQGHGLTNLFRDAHVPAKALAALLPDTMVLEQLGLARQHSLRRARHGCMPGCPNRCDQSAIVPDGAGGARAVKAGEWETYQGLVNLGLFHDLPAQAAWVLGHSNEHAYDHIEALVALAALALASEAGADTGVRYGDLASVREALQQAVGGNTDLGQLIRLGAAAVEQHHGLERHFTVGGHALPFHNPRSMLQTGVGLSWTYGRHGECCAGAGRHNFLGLPYDPADHGLPPEAHVLNSAHAMVLYGAMDAAGHCFFMGPSVGSLAEMELLLEAIGQPRSIPEALRRSARTILDVHAFDTARGVRIQPLPRVFYERATRGNAQAPQQAVAFTVPFPMVRDLCARALEGVASGAVAPPAALLDDARAAAAEGIAAD
jgi:aldehyde:ferredoxin oxidoreductase